MPSGALTISEHPGDAIEIACDHCGRRGRLAKAGLIATHGDIPLPDLINILTDGCAGRTSLSKRCHARFPALVSQST